MSKKNIKVSKKFAKRQFSTAGMALLLYALIVLILPEFLKLYFMSIGIYSDNNSLINTGILYTLIVIGTLVPFLLLKQSCHIRIKDFWRKCNAGFSDLFADSIVYSAIGTLFMFLTIVINSYIKIGDSMITSLGISVNGSWAYNPIFFVLFVIATPFVEEIAFRGILLRVLGRYGNYFAMISCSLVYAILHGSIAEVIPTFFLSIILIKLTLKYRSIQPAVVAHIIFNAILYLMALTPGKYYQIVAIVIFAIYLMAIIVVFSRNYRYVKVRQKNNEKMLYSLFFFRFTVFLSLIIGAVYTVLYTFL